MTILVTGLPRRVFERLWRSRFARNVAVVASGTAAAQAITLAFAPLITRIYGPEAFGFLGTYMAIVSVVTPLAALAYPIAIVLPKDDRDALGLVRLCIFLSIAIAVIASVLLWMLGDWLTFTLNAESVANFLFLIPLTMLLSAWVQIVNQWLIRKKEFGVIARVAVAQSLIINSAKSGLGWFNPTSAVLIVIATAGSALHALMLYFGARDRYEGESKHSEQRAGITLIKLARQHKDFPLYRAPQNFINAISQSLPVLILAAFFGPVAAGFYTLGKMTMGVPSALLGKAVSDVFYPEITESANNGGNIPRQIIHATFALLAIGLIPFGLIIFFGPWLFGLVFGASWGMAGEYARWLALFFLFNFINKPAVAAVPILGIQRGLLIYEFFSTGAKALGLVIGFFWFDSDIWAVALFSVIGVLAYSAMIFWILAHAKRWKLNAQTS
jgi:O-antigen/teichoic acid export membrane protein